LRHYRVAQKGLGVNEEERSEKAYEQQGQKPSCPWSGSHIKDADRPSPRSYRRHASSPQIDFRVRTLADPTVAPSPFKAMRFL
jgi:hypothetical protein